mmetsp:Transcript_36478/g.79433  ORF Transcript_36478/g.79433 Transcript_36478/m.79433 type:complete len:233 (+) Transcript_36478:724-1422(+)
MCRSNAVSIGFGGGVVSPVLLVVAVVVCCSGGEVGLADTGEVVGLNDAGPSADTTVCVAPEDTGEFVMGAFVLGADVGPTDTGASVGRSVVGVVVGTTVGAIVVVSTSSASPPPSWGEPTPNCSYIEVSSAVSTGPIPAGLAVGKEVSSNDWTAAVGIDVGDALLSTLEVSVLPLTAASDDDEEDDDADAAADVLLSDLIPTMPLMNNASPTANPMTARTAMASTICFRRRS